MHSRNEIFNNLKHAYKTHTKCIKQTYAFLVWNLQNSKMHMKFIRNAYEMHVGFSPFYCFFRFKSFVVATCDCYLIKQHSYFWLLLAISTCDCYVRYIHIVTFDCYLLFLLVNGPFTQLLVIGTCEWYLWLVYFWFVLVIDTCD